jgi:hypothetical protein
LYPTLKHRYFIDRNSSMPYFDSSLLLAQSRVLEASKGGGTSEPMLVSLIPIMPYSRSMCSAAFHARAKSCDNSVVSIQEILTKRHSMDFLRLPASCAIIWCPVLGRPWSVSRREETEIRKPANSSTDVCSSGVGFSHGKANTRCCMEKYQHMACLSLGS